jgi:hypothetical protein
MTAASGTTQTRPKSGPSLGRPGRRSHPFRMVRVLGRVFVWLDQSERAGARWVAALEMPLSLCLLRACSRSTARSCHHQGPEAIRRLATRNSSTASQENGIEATERGRRLRRRDGTSSDDGENCMMSLPSRLWLDPEQGSSDPAAHSQNRPLHGQIRWYR